MGFVKLGDNIYLNLDAVASITWSGEGPDLCATVNFLVASPADHNGQQLRTQVFEAEAAQALRRHLDGGGLASRPEGPEQAGASTPAAEAREPNGSYDRLDAFSFNDGQKKKWYFVKDGNGQGYFLAMVNAKGSCSMRSFDAESGRFLKKEYKHEGDFQQLFALYLKDAKEISVSRQPNLERDCRQKLPLDLLEYLKRQVSQ